MILSHPSTMLRSVFILIGCVLISGCEFSDSSTNPSPPPIVGGDALRSAAVQLNWFPESEHGGLYQAAADGTFQSHGLDVEIRPGGRQSPVAPELVLGRVQFAMANADDVVLFRNQGADIVAVLATMQNHPRCILVREDSGVKKFEDLAGKTLQRQGGRAFLEFMRSKGLLDQVKEVPYHGSVSSLVTDKNVAIQAYSFAEPLLAEQQGVKVRKLMLSDIGWNPYSSVLITTGDMVRNQPELVQDFVDATREGWQHYLDDPALGNEAILKANQHGMTIEALRFGHQELKTLALPDGMSPESLGEMTDARWQTLVSQMVELGLVDGDKVHATDCFTPQFTKKVSDTFLVE
ncbi:ABC transporter substrate-binding protein [Novipirellula rosea]|uniref:ABC transporter substrate-binding protein n=1 Tax=Novipirellula rosea TaxID=1031540 RepID=A0ABP8NJ53_9BACT